LLATRVNALLTAQAVFVAAIAFLYNDKGGTQKLLLIMIAVLGLLTTIITFVGIISGCRVIRWWLAHGKKLIEEDEAKDDKDRELKGHYLPRATEQPDWMHTLSVDVFGWGLSLCFVLFWVLVLITLLGWRLSLYFVLFWVGVFITLLTLRWARQRGHC